MAVPPYETALIVGAGEGLSASLARLLAQEGCASGWRRAGPRSSPCSGTRSAPWRSLATPRTPAQVARLFDEVAEADGRARTS